MAHTCKRTKRAKSASSQTFPESLAPDELTLAKAIELLAAPSGERELGIDPVTNLPIIAKSGRFGPYITEVLPEVPVELTASGKKEKEEDGCTKGKDSKPAVNNDIRYRHI